MDAIQDSDFEDLLEEIEKPPSKSVFETSEWKDLILFLAFTLLVNAITLAFFACSDIWNLRRRMEEAELVAELHDGKLVPALHSIPEEEEVYESGKDEEEGNDDGEEEAHDSDEEHSDRSKKMMSNTLWARPHRVVERKSGDRKD